MEPLHMVAPASDDPRRTKTFPDELAALLARITEAGIRPRDIVTPAAMRNAFVVVMAMGGSTNVVLHGPEIARAAGFDLWDDATSSRTGSPSSSTCGRSGSTRWSTSTPSAASPSW
jgi:dihydroxy-acid dehydratase